MSKKALIVAIDEYPDPYTLKSCINDLNDLSNTLTPKGFTITTITNSQATKTNIINALSNLISTSVSGDSIVFAFFGHGSYILGGNEPDGRIECICPVNVLSGYVITDDELALILNGLPSNVSCDVILGSCYSGTGTRSAVIEKEKKHSYKFPYYIPGPIALKGKTKESSIVKSSVPVTAMNHVLWAACKDSQTSWEVISGGKYRGLHTLYLCWALRNYPAYTRNQIDARITPLVTAVISTQEPQLEGNITELNQLPFT